MQQRTLQLVFQCSVSQSGVFQSTAFTHVHWYARKGPMAKRLRGCQNHTLFLLMQREQAPVHDSNESL
jgi:hypothetical protein